MKRIGLVKKRYLTKQKLNEIIELLTRPGKRNKWTPAMVKHWDQILKNKEKVIDELYDGLMNQTYKFHEFNIFYRYENGKKREIYASCPRDQIVDTLLDECLKHVFTWKKQLLHPHAYGSIQGKGQHELRIRVQKSIKGRSTCFVATLDTRKYYPTINHEVMKRTLERHIKDKWLLWLSFATIDRMHGSVGMALGLASSNILGHVYHAGMDWWITHELGAQEYYRFCDDMIIISENKYLLHSMVQKIIEKTKEDLKQEIKPTWQIVDATKERFNFLGAAISTKNAILISKGRRRVERKRIRKELRLDFNPVWSGDRNRIIRTWAGVKGGFTGLAVNNLITYWRTVKYPEFFKRLEDATNYKKKK